ncbi:FAD-dependent monooxygenase [Streptomyces sp. YKOK-I1]
MNKPRALVVGMGIGGLATALRLHDIGWETLLVERAPQRRPAGYFVGLFGTGQAAAQRLGVLDAIGNRTTPENSATYDIDRAGRRRPTLGYGDLPGNPRLLLRGDIESALYDSTEPVTEIRYGTTPVTVEEHPDGVDVTLRTTSGENTTETTERFDLVVGTDGLRSTVRQLVFGPHTDYFKPFNHIIAATVLKEPVPGFGLTDGIVLPEPGRAAWVFPFSDHRPGLLFSYRTDDEDAEFTRPPIESLRRAFGPEPTGPILEHLLQQWEQADDYLFDSAHQVVMPSWHTDRVVLLGDAAWCLTLYSGMGASSAISGADLLGTLLQRSPGNVARALREWDQKMRPFITSTQEHARRELVQFVPQNRRDMLARAITSPLVGRPMGKRLMRSLLATPFKNKSLDPAAA